MTPNLLVLHTLFQEARGPGAPKHRSGTNFQPQASPPGSEPGGQGCRRPHDPRAAAEEPPVLISPPDLQDLLLLKRSWGWGAVSFRGVRSAFSNVAGGLEASSAAALGGFSWPRLQL